MAGMMKQASVLMMIVMTAKYLFCCTAFQPPIKIRSTKYSLTSSISLISRSSIAYTRSSSSTTTFLGATSDSDDQPSSTTSSSSSSSKKRRKRKRKTTTTTVESTTTTEPTTTTSAAKQQGQPPPQPELKPRNDAPVQLEIKNVSELVSGKSSSTKTTTTTTPVSASSPTTSDTPTTNIPKAADTNQNNDSLQQLLEDARRMKAEERGESSGGVGDFFSDEEGTDLKETIRNILSTIVTADFFIVCAFLLWFLAGILWRAAFNDDTVQIAFNSKFCCVLRRRSYVMVLWVLCVWESLLDSSFLH